MANQDHVDMLLRSIREWNQWREDNPKVVPDLEESNLEKAELRVANLQSANLKNSNLRGAVLSFSNLQGANLKYANLQGALLHRVNLQLSKLHKANLEGANLKLANIQGARLGAANLQGTNLRKANLRESQLWEANLQKANMIFADLHLANLREASLQEANLQEANLKGVVLQGSNLRRAKLQKSNLQETILWHASLVDSKLWRANLKGAVLWRANLQGADFSRANLQGAKLQKSKINEETIFDECLFNSKTNFSGSSVSNARIFPEKDRTLIQRNIRQFSWNNWYANLLPERVEDWLESKYQYELSSAPNHSVNHGFDKIETQLELRLSAAKDKWLKLDLGYHFLEELKLGFVLLKYYVTRYFIEAFWYATDYGSKTTRLYSIFFGTSFFFATIYWSFESVDCSIVSGLSFNDEEMAKAKFPEGAETIGVFWRALCFSIVTMSTLGFGDITAQPWSYMGHILITLQVLLGYVLLGALITRLGILFTSAE